jgi:hypothetical protein
MPMSFGPLGRRPYSAMNDLPLPAQITINAALVGYIFTAEIYTVSGTAIRVASDEFATLDTDSMPSTPFAGVLESGLRFHRAIVDGDKLGGMSSGYSDLVINNSGGDYDAYANSLDGSRVVVKYGARGASFDTYVTLYDGVAEGEATIDEDSMTLHLYDDNKRLDIPAQPSLYGGTGGIDGDSNVAGKRKPIWLGTCSNVTVPLIDAVNLVYQLHDGPVSGILHVYDRGVELSYNSTTDYASYAALIAATITPGRFASCVAVGVIRLGAKPDGVVTVSANGAVSNGLVATYPTSGTFFSDTASAMHYLLTISTANVVVDGGAVIALKAAQGAAIGYFIGPDDDRTIRQALDDLSYGILGYAGFRRDRSFDMGLIAIPTGSPLSSYTGDGTGEDFYTLKQLPLPSVMAPPPYRIRAAYSRNWTIQTDIDATVDAGTQTLRKAPYSVAASTNSSLSTTIQAAHPQAQDPDVWPCWFVNSSDAVSFANSTLTLFGGATRNLFEMVVSADAYKLDLANPIQVTDSRYGLSGGRALAIVSIDDDTSEEQATVQGIG